MAEEGLSEDDIFERAHQILVANSPNPDEDFIEDIEDLVKNARPMWPADKVERIVLDILLEHRTGERHRSRHRVVATRASKPIRLPDADQARRIAETRKQQQRSQQASRSAKSKKKWVPLDELELAQPSEVPELSPFDSLREILGQNASDEDIERVLTHNEFDLKMTLDMLDIAAKHDDSSDDDDVGRAKEQLLTRDQTAERVMCKYFLQSGSCMRGDDCMYSHDLSQRICRFWLQNRCLAGSSCVFLHHVPEDVMNQLSLESHPHKTPSNASNPKLTAAELPALGTKLPKKKAPITSMDSSPSLTIAAGAGSISHSASQSHSSADAASTGKNSTNSAAESSNLPQKAPPSLTTSEGSVLKLNRGRVPITAPQYVPWKHLSFGHNQDYVNLRLSAKKTGDLRNKYLQQATDAWSQNNPARAKELSQRGQEYHKSMVQDQRKAADMLFEQRSLPSSEVWVDLHGHELGAAIDYLESCLKLVADTEGYNPRPVYIISSRGHFRMKRHADQLTQHVHVFLDEHGYIHKDLGSDPQFGYITGVDPWSAIKK